MLIANYWHYLWVGKKIHACALMSSTLTHQGTPTAYDLFSQKENVQYLLVQPSYFHSYASSQYYCAVCTWWWLSKGGKKIDWTAISIPKKQLWQGHRLGRGTMHNLSSMLLCRVRHFRQASLVNRRQTGGRQGETIIVLIYSPNI